MISSDFMPIASEKLRFFSYYRYGSLAERKTNLVADVIYIKNADAKKVAECRGIMLSGVTFDVAGPFI
jgi:hypothetical protein